MFFIFWIDSRTDVHFGAAGSNREKNIVLGGVASDPVETIKEPINAVTDNRHDEDPSIIHATMVW